ncbi:hypothetical protein RhiirC2_800418, partial [Rhizophagus irregularis]
IEKGNHFEDQNLRILKGKNIILKLIDGRPFGKLLTFKIEGGSLKMLCGRKVDQGGKFII